MVWFSGGRITKLSPPKPMAWANFLTMISPPWLDLLSIFQGLRWVKLLLNQRLISGIFPCFFEITKANNGTAIQPPIINDLPSFKHYSTLVDASSTVSRCLGKEH